ncbi:MAG TPA: cation:proton antiporter [Vicinamibacterales bacterium]
MGTIVAEPSHSLEKGLPESLNRDKILPAVILLLQVAVILAFARVVRWLIVPLGQPAVIGEMVAGLILGPSLIGWLMPETSATLFPPSSLPALNTLSQIGLVLFMFFVGARIDGHKVQARRNVAMVTSATSIIVPFALGAWLASTLHDVLAPAGVGALPFGLFFGTALSITAFPVLARILIDQRLLTTELGVLAIACAAFDDVTGWLILAGVTTLVRAEGSGAFVRAFVLFGGYLAVMLIIVRSALRRYVRWRGPEFGSGGDLALVLLVVVLSAIATDRIGVHALFGAFFAGLIVPEEARIERTFERHLEPLTMTFLLPLFFAFTGLRTNVTLIDNPALLLYAALILGAAVIGKAGASTIAARTMGSTWREATTLGVLLNTRGLVELVVLNIGLDLGILSPVVFSMLVLMALITTFMTSPIVHGLLQRQPARSTVSAGSWAGEKSLN